MAAGEWIAIVSIAVTIAGGLIHVLMRQATTEAKVGELGDRIERNEANAEKRETDRVVEDRAFRNFVRDRFDAIAASLTELTIGLRTRHFHPPQDDR